MGYSPQGCKELEMTEVTEHAHMYKDVTSSVSNIENLLNV